jgi:hypothetical protein
LLFRADKKGSKEGRDVRNHRLRLCFDVIRVWDRNEIILLSFSFFPFFAVPLPFRFNSGGVVVCLFSVAWQRRRSMAMAAGAAVWTSSLPSTSYTLGALALSFPPRGVKRPVTRTATKFSSIHHVVVRASSTGGGGGQSSSSTVICHKSFIGILLLGIYWMSF